MIIATVDGPTMAICGVALVALIIAGIGVRNIFVTCRSFVSRQRDVISDGKARRDYQRSGR